MTASVTHGRSLRYAGGSARGLLHHHQGHCRYKAQPLSVFLGKADGPAAPAIDFIVPLSPEEQRSSPRFFAILNFMLQFAPPHPSETELLNRFASVGIGPGLAFDVDALSPEMKAAAEGGMADAWAEFALLKARIDAGEVKSGELFGTRESMKNNYLNRMAGAVVGIYGNSQEEAIYPLYSVDGEGNPLDGNNKYVIRFAADQMPPVNAFWSLTMYKLPESLLFANPINRYLINSPMLPDLKKDEDGGLTLFIQNESPGPEWEPNWLPAPKGPFTMAMRLYWPQPEALDGSWTAPAAQKVS